MPHDTQDPAPASSVQPNLTPAPHNGVVPPVEHRFYKGSKNRMGRRRTSKELREYAKKYTIEAVNVLLQIMRARVNSSPEARVKAAGLILDRAFGKVAPASAVMRQQERHHREMLEHQLGILKLREQPAPDVNVNVNVTLPEPVLAPVPALPPWMEHNRLEDLSDEQP